MRVTEGGCPLRLRCEMVQRTTAAASNVRGLLKYVDI